MTSTGGIFKLVNRNYTFFAAPMAAGETVRIELEGCGFEFRISAMCHEERRKPVMLYLKMRVELSTPAAGIGRYRM
jgi:hypothetical protein